MYNFFQTFFNFRYIRMEVKHLKVKSMETVKVKFVFARTLDWDSIEEYSNYSLERNFAIKSKFWCASITDYSTAKNMTKKFISCSSDDEMNLIDFSNIKINEVIQIREDFRKSGKYTNRSEIDAIVKNINDTEVELVIFETLFKTIKFQNEQLNH